MLRQLFLFTFILANLPAHAQTTSPAFEKSLFWEVSGKGKSKMYILGTHHLYPNDFVKKSEPIQKALKKSQVVVGEIAIDTNQMRMAFKMMRYMFMPDNSLQKLLSPEDYKLLEIYCSDNGMGDMLAKMNTLKPIILYQALTAQKYAEAVGEKGKELNMGGMQGMNMDNSIDAYVQKEGTRQKKQVRGLEEIEDQANILFNGYSVERQAEMLMELVKNEEKSSSTDLKKMNELYESQDIETLFAMTQQHMTPEENKMLLANRNNKWIPQLERLLENHKVTFIAVGAGHLVGADGVLTQLRAKGYTVKPIAIALK
jgi:uncharacterized protein YbaP (TraB family)